MTFHDADHAFFLDGSRARWLVQSRNSVLLLREGADEEPWELLFNPARTGFKVHGAPLALAGICHGFHYRLLDKFNRNMEQAIFNY